MKNFTIKERQTKTQMGWSYDYFVYVKGKDIGRFEMLADAKTFCDVDAKKAHQTASIIIEKMN
jgi:hypothetical protein